MDKDNIGTIVVVDDDEDILYTLKEGLRFRLPSFKVKTATNSKDAIELIELSKPDLEQVPGLPEGRGAFRITLQDVS